MARRMMNRCRRPWNLNERCVKKEIDHERHPIHLVSVYPAAHSGRDPYARENVGENYFDMARPCTCREGEVVLYKPDGDTVMITAEKKPVRFLLVSGKPLKEPIAWYGPIVMNTQEELRAAFDEFQGGTFIKHQAVGARPI